MSDYSTMDGLFDPRSGHSGAGRSTAGAAGSAAGVLAPLLIGGAFAVVALAGQSRVGHWLRGFLGARDVAARRRTRARRIESALVTPPRMREMILGQSKAAVASRFGPPRTAVVSNATRTAGQNAFWVGDTWYYALDAVSCTAMAIRFDRDIAVAVEFFEAPASPTSPPL
jgi:hypothetical protein